METILDVIKDELKKKLSGCIKFDIESDSALVMSLDHKDNLPLGSIVKFSNQNRCTYSDNVFTETKEKFNKELEILKKINYKKYLCKVSLFEEYNKVYNEIKNIICEYLGG